MNDTDSFVFKARWQTENLILRFYH